MIKLRFHMSSPAHNYVHFIVLQFPQAKPLPRTVDSSNTPIEQKEYSAVSDIVNYAVHTTCAGEIPWLNYLPAP
jgi:hypothetical protein